MLPQQIPLTFCILHNIGVPKVQGAVSAAPHRSAAGTPGKSKP